MNGGYRGGALNLAARLCSLAQPGEVLVSEGLAHLARKVDDTTYVDRGRISVKGLPERVRVYQVSFLLDMPADEPTPRGIRTTVILAAAAVAAIAILAVFVALLTTGFAGSDPPKRIEENALGEIDSKGAKLVAKRQSATGPPPLPRGSGRSGWRIASTGRCPESTRNEKSAQSSRCPGLRAASPQAREQSG